MPVSLALYANLKLGGFIKDLWHTRAVGIKLSDFECDPKSLAKSIHVKTEFHCKGAPHGTKNKWKHHDIFIAKAFDQERNFDEILLELVDELGGVSELRRLIQEVNAKNGGFVVNLPTSDIYAGLGSGISTECANLLIEFNFNLGINYF